MSKSKIFNSVPANHPTLNRFDLSYTNTTSMTFGYLYPVQCDEVYPGDVFKMHCYCHAEVMPMLAPVMSDMQLFAHTFFVPYRLIYGVDSEDGISIWEKFITGGKDGDYDVPLPAWDPSLITSTGFSSKLIWDHVGNPMAYNSLTGVWSPVVPASNVPVSIAPKYSYNFIYNCFYRDESLVSEVALTNEDLLLCAFKKDYFTSALESQLRMSAPPALPVDVTLSGSAPVKFLDHAGDNFILNSNYPYLNPAIYSEGGFAYGGSNSSSHSVPSTYPSAGDNAYISGSVDASGLTASATTFTVSDLRLAFAIQRLLELNETGGYRYTEWLHSHFSANPTDSRLDRPEYIGGALINISVSPVVQNSGTQTESGTQETPQGQKVGIGSVDTVQKIGNYRVLEHGLIMTLVSIRPKPIYSQGINKQWLHRSRFDFYTPELAYLSEDRILNAELYVDGTLGDESNSNADFGTFGYQAHWNEMRCKNNMVSGAVRQQFNYWTLDRQFSSRPHLNQDFIEIDPDDFTKIFAVQDEDPFVVSWSNIIDAYRPLPAMGTPGLIDHVYGGR